LYGLIQALRLMIKEFSIRILFGVFIALSMALTIFIAQQFYKQKIQTLASFEQIEKQLWELEAQNTNLINVLSESLVLNSQPSTHNFQSLAQRVIQNYSHIEYLTISKQPQDEFVHNLITLPKPPEMWITSKIAELKIDFETHKNTQSVQWQFSQIGKHFYKVFYYQNDSGSMLMLFVNFNDRLKTLIKQQKNLSLEAISIAFKNPTQTVWLQNSAQPFWTISLQKNLSISATEDQNILQLSYPLGWPKVSYSELIKVVFFVLLIFFLTLLVISSKIKQDRKLKQSNQRLKEILKTSHDAVVITDHLGIIKVWNPEAEKIFGFSSSDVIGQSIVETIFNHKTFDESKGSERNLFNLLNHPEKASSIMTSTQKAEIPVHTKGQFDLLIEVTYSILQLSKLHEISFFIEDVTHRRKNENEIMQLAYFDTLTSLENRSYFKRQLTTSIHAHQPFFLAFIDLDGFKKINDSLGHEAGDELLKSISACLKRTFREHRLESISHIGRFGGDEFTLLIKTADRRNLEKIIQNVLRNIEKPINIKETLIQVSGSIGIAQFPQHGQDEETLLRLADLAMYQAKEQGKNTYVFYDPEMGTKLSQKILIEKNLHNALKNDEFYLVYQPKLELKTGKIIGVEALLRWRSPVLGNVRPDEFISIAEENPMIDDIGYWVLSQAIHQLKLWQYTPYQDIKIAINVSSKQLKNPNFLSDISRELNTVGVSPSLLQIELTESAIMKNPDENVERFNLIRQKGFGLSVDDFGTGYSSLSYLKKFPLSELKVDKSFVDGLPYEENDVSISNTIIQLAHNLKMVVVAEGVETLQQLNYLIEVDCDIVQGYFISYPLEAHAVETWLSNNQQDYFNGPNHLKQITQSTQDET
jgi:diguanylate cyclase (GGDEF)-like protein/PAS domain S-box-containing protein